jgi:hypothetical protein
LAAEKILAGDISAGKNLVIDVKDGNICIDSAENNKN